MIDSSSHFTYQEIVTLQDMSFFMFTLQYAANKFRKLEELVGKPTLDADITTLSIASIAKSAFESISPPRAPKPPTTHE